MKIVLVTGTRDHNYFDHNSVGDIVREARPDLVIHGDCPTGIDAIVKEFCLNLGITQIPMPAMWNEFGRKAGFIRNSDMASTFKNLQHYGHELVCLGFPKGNSHSGTRHCMSEAEKYGWQVFNCGDE